MLRLFRLVGGLATLALTGCSTLPIEPPPLADMEEPLPLFEEPDDEDERLALPPGSFTGIYVTDARDTMEALMGEPEGVVVTRVVENSPAEAAGVRVHDLLFEVEQEGEVHLVNWPSQWRAIEVSAPAGDELVLFVERAGAELELPLRPVERVRAGARQPIERLREEYRLGFVVRTPSEVEARAAGLGPGGGAVLVGLSRRSPLRKAGLVYGDLITRVDDTEVAHPVRLIELIQAHDAGDEVALTYHRDGETRTLSVPLTSRDSHVRELSVPLIFSYDNDGREQSSSFLLGLFRQRRTRAAWDIRLLWLFSFGAGDADELIEVDA